MGMMGYSERIRDGISGAAKDQRKTQAILGAKSHTADRVCFWFAAPVTYLPHGREQG